jgi:hypothetical protein
MRSMKQVNDIGVRALVDALGKEDAQRFFAQFGSATATASAASPRDERVADESIPPMTIEEAHQTIRDLQDPMDQQHML